MNWGDSDRPRRAATTASGRARRGSARADSVRAAVARAAVAALAVSAWIGTAALPARADSGLLLPPQAGTGFNSASLPPATVPAAELALPDILSYEDAALYRETFGLQDKGLWAAADRRIKRINDRLLMGHVLAQRYLHPTHYRARYDELAAWLRQYADHPDAARIYGLAMKRKPKAAKAPPAPRDRFAVSSDNIDTEPAPRRPWRESAAEPGARRNVAKMTRAGRMTEAEKFLAQPSVQRVLGQGGVDRTRALIAAAWFRKGDDARAYAVASAAARRSGAEAPRALWWAGLAAFRLGRFEDAISHFDRLARAKGLSTREIAAANFWAGRAALRGGHAERVGAYMDRAARHDRTFYGQIAARIRGTGPTYNWGAPTATPADVVAFSAHRAGRRTLALIQVGDEGRAETELRTLRVGASPRLLRTVMALAEAADMPGTALRAGRVLLRAQNERVDAALYPIPHWVPETGFQIDRALVYALARQESGFNVRARSPAGARGLLQLMPATARFIADSGQNFRGRNGNHLYDPRLNLALGQKYVDHLLADDAVSGNLIMMIAAYNGGPGNLAKWQRQVRHGSDPLIFIESIPVTETRLFVTRVLENLWIYRARLGQDTPSLEALASGVWPAYVGLDGARFGVAEDRR